MVGSPNPSPTTPAGSALTTPKTSSPCTPFAPQLIKGVGACVPFVNRPFESEIHGTVNFTYFCCVLLVTWCYRVLLSCYLRPK